MLVYWKICVLYRKFASLYDYYIVGTIWYPEVGTTIYSINSSRKIVFVYRRSEVGHVKLGSFVCRRSEIGHVKLWPAWDVCPATFVSQLGPGGCWGIQDLEYG